MSPVIGKKACKAILEILEGPDAPMPREPYIIHEIQQALKTKPFVKLARKRVKAKKAERQDEWAQIREKVFKRAGGQCENCGVTTDTLTADHVFQGANRKTLQSIYTVRAICSLCDRQRTLNIPDAGYWLIRFVEHCAREASKYGDMAEDEPNGYAHAADIAKARLESLQIQGRAEPEPTVPVFGLLAKYAKPSTERDWDVGGPRDEEIAASLRAGNTEKRRFERERKKKRRGGG